VLAIVNASSPGGVIARVARFPPPSRCGASQGRGDVASNADAFGYRGDVSWQQREQERRVVVASVPTSSEADFLRISLAVRGIEAMVSPASVYPSVDFVEGVRITVRASDEVDAREILGLLGVDGPEPG
jgi:hypothetical protein